MTMESQHLSVIRVWAALAWADGVIAKSEAAAMNRLIDGTTELSDAERATAKGFLTSKVELETASVAKLAPEAREGIYRAAVRLAGIDLDVAEAELSFLKRLRDGLGLSAARADEIQASIPAPRNKKK